MVCGRLFLMKCIFASAVIASAVILDEQIVPEEEFTEIVAADPIRVRVMAHPTEYALPSSTVVAPVPEEEFTDTVPEPTATAANGQSWTDSQQVCTNQGKQLCTFDKICPNGEGSTPVDGGSSVGHDWSPMLRADGVTNDWVHISGSGHSNCKPHGKYHGLPGWGTQPSNTYNHRIYCCGQPSTATSEDMPVKCYQLQHPSRKWEQGEQAGAFYYTGISASQYRFKPVCLLSFGKMNERKVRYMCGDCSEVSCCPNTLGQNDQTWTTTTDANTCSVRDNSGFRKCKAADTNINMRHLSYKSEEQCTPYYMGSANIQEKCGDARPPPPPDCTNAARLASGCTWMIQKYGKANICTEGFVGCPCDCP